nr:unnamed protein product [Spirometra erinaceieuropaei]
MRTPTYLSTIGSQDLRIQQADTQRDMDLFASGYAYKALEDLAKKRPAWSRNVKTGAETYGVTLVAVDETKKVACKSLALRSAMSPLNPTQRALAVNEHVSFESASSVTHEPNASTALRQQLLPSRPRPL